MLNVRKRKPNGMAWSLDLLRHWSVVDESTGCWLWQKAINASTGYGVIRLGRRTVRAHRLAYQIATGREVPHGLDICHKCDVRACVNPEHLFEGTRTDNMRDCASKGRIRVPGMWLKGESCPAAKLTAEQVRQIRASGRPMRALAREYGVARRTIKMILLGCTWKSVA